MSTPKKILFVDDELFFAQPYLEELQKLSPVVILTTALEAEEEIRNKEVKYVCLVLDVMLPPPNGWEVKTKDGLDTGIEILRRCFQEITDRKLPVVVLTHRSLGYVRGEVDLINFPPELVRVEAKIETPPFHLTTVVKRLVKKWKNLDLPS